MTRPLVISGGGAKGACAAGVLDTLMIREGLTFDLVSGTSTGAILAPFANQGVEG
jgi:predicted acylesterase/phospholipase RssA